MYIYTYTHTNTHTHIYIYIYIYIYMHLKKSGHCILVVAREHSECVAQIYLFTNTRIYIYSFLNASKLLDKYI